MARSLCLLHQQNSKEGIEVLSKEIIPRFGLPLGLSLDREIHSVAETVQSLCKVLGNYMESSHSLETSVQWKNRKDELKFEMAKKLDLSRNYTKMASGFSFSLSKN